jgi:hypothetical protein
MASELLNEIYAVVQDDGRGEVICFFRDPETGRTLPLVGSGELDQIASLKMVARAIAKNTGCFTKLLKFESRTLVEEFSPIVRGRIVT